MWLLMLIKQEPLIAGGDFVGGYKTHQLIILETVNRSIFLRVYTGSGYVSNLLGRLASDQL